MLVCLQDFDFRQAVGGEGDGCGGMVALDIVSVAMEEVQLNRCQSQRKDLNQVMGRDDSNWERRTVCLMVSRGGDGLVLKEGCRKNI